MSGIEQGARVSEIEQGARVSEQLYLSAVSIYLAMLPPCDFCTSPMMMIPAGAPAAAPTASTQQQAARSTR